MTSALSNRARRGEKLPSAFLIVCPTSKGGHIEHAHDLGVGIAELTGAPVRLMTRPGAVEYLGAVRSSKVEIIEAVPDLPPRRVWYRGLALASCLLREYWSIATHSRSRARWTLIVEEPRYPLRPFRFGRLRTVLFLHNVVEHPSDDDLSRIAWVKRFFRLMCIRNADAIVVHGDQQRMDLRRAAGRDATATPLPGASYLTPAASSRPEFQVSGGLCIGEIRRDKGLTLAVEASRRSRLPLTILGAPSDQTYAEEISHAVSGADWIRYAPSFLSAADFGSALAAAHYVVLPYTSMAGQSGVLARAMDARKCLVVADLPALMEQVSDYPAVVFFRAGDPDSLAEACRRAAAEVPLGGPDSRRVVSSPGEWQEVARAVVALVQ